MSTLAERMNDAEYVQVGKAEPPDGIYVLAPPPDDEDDPEFDPYS
jgi:hypothetical protein